MRSQGGLRHAADQVGGERDPADVELTDAGYGAWRAAMNVVGQEEHRILGVLDPAERSQLAGLLRRVLVAAEGAEPDDAAG